MKSHNNIISSGNNWQIVSRNWLPVEQLLAEFRDRVQTLEVEWRRTPRAAVIYEELFHELQLYEAFAEDADAPAWAAYERTRKLHLLNLLIAD